VAEDANAMLLRSAFETVPGLVALVLEHDLAPSSDDALTAFACELVLEALVARRKISRSDRGRYGRAQQEQGRRRRGDAPPEGFTG
jgi:magnesium chelatase subunit I